MHPNPTIHAMHVHIHTFMGKLIYPPIINKTTTNHTSKVKALLRQATAELQRHSHPDKYILPWMPGGTLFMRNPPLPFDVRACVFLWGFWRLGAGLLVPCPPSRVSTTPPPPLPIPPKLNNTRPPPPNPPLTPTPRPHTMHRSPTKTQHPPPFKKPNTPHETTTNRWCSRTTCPTTCTRRPSTST